jgi:hypothetical protein
LFKQIVKLNRILDTTISLSKNVIIFDNFPQCRAYLLLYTYMYTYNRMMLSYRIIVLVVTKIISIKTNVIFSYGEAYLSCVTDRQGYDSTLVELYTVSILKPLIDIYISLSLSASLFAGRSDRCCSSPFRYLVKN